jgi:hypothetical protein
MTSPDRGTVAKALVASLYFTRFAARARTHLLEAKLISELLLHADDFLRSLETPQPAIAFGRLTSLYAERLLGTPMGGYELMALAVATGLETPTVDHRPRANTWHVRVEGIKRWLHPAGQSRSARTARSSRRNSAEVLGLIDSVLEPSFGELSPEIVRDICTKVVQTLSGEARETPSERTTRDE